MTEPVVRLVMQDNVVQDLFDDFESAVRDEGIRVERIERPPGVFAALELFIPPAAILQVGAGVFALAFAKAAGKGVWTLMEKAVTELAKRLLGPAGPQVELVGTTGKLPRVSRYSHRFGVAAELAGGVSLRLVFAPGEDPGPAVTRFFELLAALHGPDRDTVTIAGDGGSGRHGLFVRYNAKTDELVLINPMDPSPQCAEEE
jgi:hypothetical protein